MAQLISIVQDKGLNPCFNGRCTSTVPQENYVRVSLSVLILVLMEDALVRSVSYACKTSNIFSLNPCFNGRCTSTAKLR